MNNTSNASKFESLLAKAKERTPDKDDLVDLYGTQVKELGESKGILDIDAFVNGVLEKSANTLADFAGRQDDFTFIVCRIACENLRTNFPQNSLQLSQTQEHVAVLRVFFGLSRQRTAYAMDLTLRQVKNIEELTRSNLSEFVENPDKQETDTISIPISTILNDEFDDQSSDGEKTIQIAPIPIFTEPVPELLVEDSLEQEANSLFENSTVENSEEIEDYKSEDKKKSKLLIYAFIALPLFSLSLVFYLISNLEDNQSSQALNETQNTVVDDEEELSPLDGSAIITDTQTNEIILTEDKTSEETVDTDKKTQITTTEPETNIASKSKDNVQINPEEQNNEPEPRQDPEPNPTPITAAPAPTNPEPEPEPVITVVAPFTFKGVVRNSDNAPAFRVLVILDGQLKTYSATTDLSGRFSINGIDSGCYTLRTNASQTQKEVCFSEGPELESTIIRV